MIELDTHTRTVLWIGIGIYTLAMLLIGYISGRRVKDMNDFLVAGRRLPLWMATATLLATWFGAGSSMGVAATVYAGDLRDVIADPFAASISLILAGFFIVGYLRKMNCYTVTDIIQKKYGRRAGIYASLWMIPVYVGWLGAQMLGLGTILHLLTGINMLWGTIIGSAVILIYTASGGMWAVTLTDIVQVSLIIIGLLIIVPGAVHLAGGWEAVYQNPNADLSLLPAPESTGWSGRVNYLGNWMVMGLGCMVGQDLVQRSLASRTETIARRSSVISGILYMLIGMIPITIGLAAKLVFPKLGITADAFGSDLENQVLPRMAIQVLGDIHPILLTVFLSALISAIMSSADSSLLAASSLFSNNVLHTLYPKIPEQKMLVLVRVITVLILVIATVLALKVQSIYALMINCWASQLVIVFIPVVTAMYFPKSTKRSALWTMGSATVVWLGYMLLTGLSIGGGFTDVMDSDGFQFALTNGAVYGFVAGIAAFAIAYAFDLYEQRNPAPANETVLDR